MHHEILLLLLGRQLYKAPIGDSPQRILDVGTGTGIWAIDVAEQHSSAEVIGMDLRYSYALSFFIVHAITDGFVVRFSQSGKLMIPGTCVYVEY
jgi:methylase of polypeptide subunit release factors